MIEGLARVDTVCLDKTGTLTEGGMDVVELRPLPGPGRPGGPPRAPEVPGADGPPGADGADGPADPAVLRTALGVLAGADARPNPSMRAIIDAYGSAMAPTASGG